MKFTRLNLLVPALAAGVLCIAPARAFAEQAYGLTTTSQLISFDTANPAGATLVGTTSGLGAGQQLVGIDFQPSSFGSNPVLYALGYNVSTNVAQLYTVNRSSGALTAFGSASQLGTGTSGNTTAFGFDFNPSSGGIRIVSSAVTSTGQNNFRFNAAGTALTTDTTLAYASGDSGFGQTAAIVGAAYSNNFAGTTSTTLYGYDFNRDALVTIGGVNGTVGGGPNGGVLNTVGTFGSAVQAQTSAVGFDISSATGTAFLTSVGLSGATNLYTVNLTNGAPTLVGNFGTFSVTDISVIPEPGSVALSALGLGALGVVIRRRKKA